MPKLKVFTIVLLAILSMSDAYALSVQEKNLDGLQGYRLSKFPVQVTQPKAGGGIKGLIDEFDSDSPWLHCLGYQYRNYYPLGFTIGGIQLGFATKENKVDISSTEYREPTWAIHIPIGYRIRLYGMNNISIKPAINMGLNVAKTCTLNENTLEYDVDKTPYFGISPMLYVELALVYFHFGYEFVPAFKELNGWYWGVGFSLPLGEILADF